MIDFLNLVRWKNLLLIALVQSLIKYALFPSSEATITLSDFQFTLLLLATLFIAAAGNIINDIYDVETDLVNKPNKIIVGKHISEKAAFNLFIIFNIFGVGIGFYLANDINKSGFATLFVIISAPTLRVFYILEIFGNNWKPYYFNYDCNQHLNCWSL